MSEAFTSDELDAKWRQLADSGDDFAKKLDEDFQNTVRRYESLLRSLRKYAELKLTKEAEDH